MEIQGLERLTATLRALAAKQIQGGAEVVVGYTADYAIRVHENIEMKGRGKPRPDGLGVYWGPHGQAKFLEEPAKRLVPELRVIIVGGLRKGWTMAQALVMAGLRLQRESQKLVPVHFGNLRASAFTRVEKGG